MEGHTLVMVLHGFSDGPSRFEHVRKVISNNIPDAKVIVPSMPLGTFSTAQPDQLVSVLLDQIDKEWAAREFQQLILVGHSMGAVLARKMYVVACDGEYEVESAGMPQRTRIPRPWAHTVDRLVLLAGMNGGWSIDYHMKLRRALLFNIGVVAGWIIHGMTRRWPTVFHMRKGAPFLTQLRVEWLLMRRRVSRDPSEPGGALVVQLLGTIDDVVSPLDNVDLLTGEDFYFLDVPATGHREVTQMDETPAGRGRAKVFAQALTGTASELAAATVAVADINPVRPVPEATQIVFVMHGIRDEGFWTEKVARKVIERGRDSGIVFARQTSSYGYFGMLPFLLRWKRRQKVEWLMDRYVETLARYPNVEKIHYVGHSNGTYLLSNALENYPCCRFDRIVFAGSVVRTNYDWGRFVSGSTPRVAQVLNFAANGDWVVAWFPSCFEYLGVSDLGGAGYVGFLDAKGSGGTLPGVLNVEYIAGAHGAAVVENNWDNIASFIVDGAVPNISQMSVKTARTHSKWVALFAASPPFVWLLISAILMIVPAILVHLASENHHHWHEWWVPLSLAGYLYAVLYIGKRL